MMDGKCKCGRLCPLSFGLALAVTYAVAVVLMAIAVLLGFASHEMSMAFQPHMAWSVAFMHLAWALLKGFVFGVIFAFLYNGFAHCMARCCRKSGDACGCGPEEQK